MLDKVIFACKHQFAVGTWYYFLGTVAIDFMPILNIVPRTSPLTADFTFVWLGALPHPVILLRPFASSTFIPYIVDVDVDIPSSLERK